MRGASGLGWGWCSRAWGWCCPQACRFTQCRLPPAHAPTTTQLPPLHRCTAAAAAAAGTPVQNNMRELFGLMNCLDQERWPDVEEFLAEFGDDSPSVEQIKRLQVRRRRRGAGLAGRGGCRLAGWGCAGG